jgi:transposase
MKKGYGQFETIVYTPEQVLETMTGRQSVDLEAVLKQIPGIDRIQMVCMDMCAAFADAVRKALPQAEIVCDRFHLVKMLNKKLDQLRIGLYKSLNEAKQERFKSIRFLLFKDRRELLKSERRLVKEYLQHSNEMKEIYWLTQSFRRILFGRQKNRQALSNALLAWCEKAKKYLRKFVKTLNTWWDEVVNACLFPVSNGRAEGVNNKIKLIKRRAYGFRNRLNFRHHILATCNP